MKTTPNLHRSSLDTLNTRPPFLFTTRSTYMVNVGRLSFHRLPFLRHPMGQSEKEQNPKLAAQTVPDRKCFRGTGRNFPTHRSIGPRPIFPFFLSHLVAQSSSPRHTLPNRSTTDPLFFFYTTSWHRAEALDALLKRSTGTTM